MQATATLVPSSPRIIAWSRMGDEALAGRAAAGSQAAFAALYERYHAPLLSYCRSILLNAEDAGDATQSALENALRALPRREPGRPLRPWLYRIAHNEAINIVRRRQHVAVGDLDTESLLTVPGPEADSDQRSRLHQLVDDLRSLPERQRGALVMRELSGLSYDEIGVALGVSNEAARRAVFDARTALHAVVDGRATECTSVRRCLSDGDRRRLRARGVRAHLRACDDCRTFERTIGVRQGDLHALGPWIGGTSMLGLLGLGGGTAKAALVASSSSAVATGAGGLGWAGLPVAVKGFAVAAVVATTGTAAVELPKVAGEKSPAPQTRAAVEAAAGAPAAISGPHDALREQALAHAAAQLRARRARGAAARRSAAASRAAAAAKNATISTLDRSVARSRPLAPAPAVTAPPPTAARPAPATLPAPSAARTDEQLAAERLERIREQMLAAFGDAQRIADSGTGGALATANALIQDTLASVRPMLDRILATFGLELPAGTMPSQTTTTTTSTPTTVTNILAPAQNLLSGINTTLQNLFGRR